MRILSALSESRCRQHFYADEWTTCRPGAKWHISNPGLRCAICIS